MSLNLVERYSLKRLRSIVVVTAFAAALAWAVGYTSVSWGALAGLPVAIVNYLIVYRAVHKSERDKAAATTAILTSVFGRMAISLLTLWIASRYGIEFMLGALCALVAEMISYTGDTFRLILSQRGSK